MLLAGPPCQGYSSLNNYSRQKDKRNGLYERVGRFIEIFKPDNILIENVSEVIHSKTKAVAKTLAILNNNNYTH